MRAVAEFVTTEKTLRLVDRLGVDYAQGYHIAHPAPLAELLSASNVDREPS